MDKIEKKNYDIALKLFKEETIDSVMELYKGMDADTFEGYKGLEDMIRKAKSFDGVELILINEVGYETDMVSAEYRHAMARLVGMKKKDLFIAVI